MTDSEKYRQETIERHQKREKQAQCPHELQQVDVRKGRYQCMECGKLLPKHHTM